jgi:hypothetical protein
LTRPVGMPTEVRFSLVRWRFIVQRLRPQWQRTRVGGLDYRRHRRSRFAAGASTRPPSAESGGFPTTSPRATRPSPTARVALRSRRKPFASNVIDADCHLSGSRSRRGRTSPRLTTATPVARHDTRRRTSADTSSDRLPSPGHRLETWLWSPVHGRSVVDRSRPVPTAPAHPRQTPDRASRAEPLIRRR